MQKSSTTIEVSLADIHEVLDEWTVEIPVKVYSQKQTKHEPGYCDVEIDGPLTFKTASGYTMDEDEMSEEMGAGYTVIEDYVYVYCDTEDAFDHARESIQDDYETHQLR